jgi:uncharacterized membrane protein
MTPEELGRELRDGSGTFLRRRRGIVGLSLFSVASMSLIALYQIGILKHVPEPSLPGFDADKVNGSAQAYEILQTPDAVLAVGSYAATAALAAMGPPDRARTMPWVPLVMAVKTAFDAVLAVKLLIEQPTRYQTFCLWCLLSAGATLTTAPLAWPEARQAVRQLQGASQ